MDWKNLKVSAKEFLAGIVFVFSISGLYYKLYYEDDRQKMERANYERQNDLRLEKLGLDIEVLKKQVNDLRDAEIRRKAIEDSRNIDISLTKTR